MSNPYDTESMNNDEAGFYNMDTPEAEWIDARVRILHGSAKGQCGTVTSVWVEEDNDEDTIVTWLTIDCDSGRIDNMMTTEVEVI